MRYLDAGTTYSKIISDNILSANIVKTSKIEGKTYNYYILESKKLREIGIIPDMACGHMTGINTNENEIIALAKGSLQYIEADATVLDLGSRDAKWVKFKNNKFNDMDWNSACASSTGATVEMLLKFYDISANSLTYTNDRFNVTCGIFGLEKIMDAIAKGENPSLAISNLFME